MMVIQLALQGTPDKWKKIFKKVNLGELLTVIIIKNNNNKKNKIKIEGMK